MKTLALTLCLALSVGCAGVMGGSVTAQGNGQAEVRTCETLTTTTTPDGTVTEECIVANYRIATGAEGSEGLWQAVMGALALVLSA